jgi:hypothetical protein
MRRRLEHSEIIEECKTAIQQLADEQGSFTKTQVAHGS